MTTTSNYLPNFSIFDQPSPSSSTAVSVSESYSSVHSPATPASTSPLEGFSAFKSAHYYNELNSSPPSGWIPEEKSNLGPASHGQQPQLQQYQYVQSQHQQEPFSNPSSQQHPNVFPTFQMGTDSQAQLHFQTGSVGPIRNAGSRKVARKQGSAPRNTRRGEDGAQKRALHNATERARRETLNGRFLDLAAVIPATSDVRRPSKPLIVKSALSFVSEALKTEPIYREQINSLTNENEKLLKELNEERGKVGLPDITSNLSQEFVMPSPLSEMKSDGKDGEEGEGEGDNDNGSENDFGVSNQSTGESDSNLYSQFNQCLATSTSTFDDFQSPTFLAPVGLQSFAAPSQEIATPTSMFFASMDGRRHSVAGFNQNYSLAF